MYDNPALKGIVIKKKDVYLPSIGGWHTVKNYRVSQILKYGFCEIGTDILVEERFPALNGYKLYGTDIPIMFVYKKGTSSQMIKPSNTACVGVGHPTWASSLEGQKCYENTSIEFNCPGTTIVDEEVIKWLENEDNIETMKYVKTCALEYQEKMIHYLNDQERRKIEYQTKRNENYKELIRRRDELVEKYQ